MNAVGIDVSSRKSTVAVLRPLGEVVCLPFDVTHDIAGLASLSFALIKKSTDDFPSMLSSTFDSLYYSTTFFLKLSQTFSRLLKPSHSFSTF